MDFTTVKYLDHYVAHRIIGGWGFPFWEACLSTFVWFDEFSETFDALKGYYVMHSNYIYDAAKRVFPKEQRYIFYERMHLAGRKNF